MTRLRLLRKPALLLAGFVVLALTLRFLPGDRVRALLLGTAPLGGPAGASVLLLGGGVLCAVGAPRQVVAFACGYGFGAAGGAALGVGAALLGCVVDFVWARALARDWAQRRLRGRWARLDGFLAANPFTATLTLRLLPVGNNLATNLLAGISTVPPLPFFLASAVGYLPQTLIFALIGSGAHVDRSTQLAVGTALFVVSGLFGLVLLRRTRMPVAGPVLERGPAT